MVTTFTVWLLVLVNNRTDDASIISYYHTEKACQIEEATVEKDARKQPEFLKTYHYECVQGTVLHNPDDKGTP